VLALMFASTCFGCGGDKPATETTDKTPAAEATPAESAEELRGAIDVDWQDYAFTIEGHQMGDNCGPNFADGCFEVVVSYEDPATIFLEDFQSAAEQSPIVLAGEDGTEYKVIAIRGIGIGEDISDSEAITLANTFFLQYDLSEDLADSLTLHIGRAIIPLSELLILEKTD